MKPLVIAPLRALPSISQSPLCGSFPQPHGSHHYTPLFRFSTSSSVQSHSSKAPVSAAPGSVPDYKHGMFDRLLLSLFRKKMVEEVGWDSEKPGYEGLIEVANHLMIKGRGNFETIEAAVGEHLPGVLEAIRRFALAFRGRLIEVRILESLFPPLLMRLYRKLIAPIGNGKLAAEMVARVTALSCQWLMGPCKVNSVALSDGSTGNSGVFVERCKYLEESKCIGICINTCKLPTQTFFRDGMGVPLLMEPNFQDYSCQFSFGVLPPPAEDDGALKEPCLAVCPNVVRRREMMKKEMDVLQCPKA